jgi:hypothetical protein
MYYDNPNVICPSIADRCDLFIAPLNLNNSHYAVGKPVKLIHSDKYGSVLRQKNWSPFIWKNQLCMTYSINPHEVLSANVISGICKPIAISSFPSKWKWGTLRGGTPAQLIDGQYLAFFHSSTWSNTRATRSGQKLLHYYMGAYIFSQNPPFKIKKITPFPISSSSFYTKSSLDKRVIFPSGFVNTGEYLYVSYGKDDREIWVAAINKQKLMAFMIPCE